jgi:GDPmannose 4,6-dehydratase
MASPNWPLTGSSKITENLMACTPALEFSSITNHRDGVLGNLNAARDWGHAKDYVEAMWLMLQQEEADEYVVATGETHSVRQFVEMCFKEVGKEITWEGEAENEIGLVDGRVVIKVSPKFYRPCEVDALIGNASKIKKLGWVQKNTIHDLIRDMMSS